MSQGPRACRLYSSPSGCPYGDRCYFSHAQAPSDTPTRSDKTNAHPFFRFNVPPGPSSAVSIPGTKAVAEGNEPINFEPPRLQRVLMQTLHTRRSNVLFPRSGISPEDVHRRLNTFLRPAFEFDHPDQAKVLGSMLMSMNSWSDHAARAELVARMADRNRSGASTLRKVLIADHDSVTTSFASPKMSFQQTMVPVLLFLSSEQVLDSTSINRSHLLGIVELSLVPMLESIQCHLTLLLKARQLKAPGNSRNFNLVTYFQVVWPTCILLEEYTKTFSEAADFHRKVLWSFCAFLLRWLQEWLNLLQTGGFDEDLFSSLSTKEQQYCVKQAEEVLLRLQARLTPDVPEPSANSRRPQLLTDVPSISTGQLASLHAAWERTAPGELRKAGRRHDNDHADITRIKIGPTAQELRCDVPPFLPSTVAGAPHHLPENSMARVIDTQFRLLRHEFLGPLLETLPLLIKDLRQTLTGNDQENECSRLLASHGGLYRGPEDGATLRLYGDGEVKFSQISISAKGPAVGIILPAPASLDIRDAHRKNSVAYWQSITKHGLTPGALVAYVALADSEAEMTVQLGTVVSYLGDQCKRFIGADGSLTIDVHFFDNAMLEVAAGHGEDLRGISLIAEVSGVLFSTVEPFLRSLQRLADQACDIPFSEVITSRAAGSLRDVEMKSPNYSRIPGFTFDLTGLLKKSPPQDQAFLELLTAIAENLDEAPSETTEERDSSTDGSTDGAQDAPTLHVEPENIRQQALLADGVLDGSQMTALLSTLDTQVSLIQGPPGTGKSYTGVHLLSTLLNSDISPILVVCVTNHALDRFLDDLHRHGISSLVRLGSRSQLGTISEFNLDRLCEAVPRARGGEYARAFKTMKKAEQSMLDAAKVASRAHWSYNLLQELLEDNYPRQLHAIQQPPDHIAQLWKEYRTWSRADKPSYDETLLSYWGSLQDIERSDQATHVLNDAGVLSSSTVPQQRDDDNKKPATNMWNLLQSEYDSDDSEPANGSDDGDDDSDVGWFWNSDESAELDKRAMMSTLDADVTHSSSSPSSASQASTLVRPLEELLADTEVWTFSPAERQRLLEHWQGDLMEIAIPEMDRTAQELSTAKAAINELKDQTRLQVAREAKVIGCTTTGAAQLCGLLERIKPRVLVVEEAGENARGGQAYRLDLSLMERLASECRIPMRRLEVQRRMRPEISELVRGLYENLEDHNTTLDRPDIKGLGKNVMWIHHTHREETMQHSTSKSNGYEVGMAAATVRHLLNQGYTKPGDICILVTYLGQLARMRQRLASEHISVRVDERDEAALHAASAIPDSATLQPEEMKIKNMSLGTAVRIGTVDRFQGEEAKIVIISLVRNEGDLSSFEAALSSRSAGFVKSTNRANVALSRARDAMIVMGNATQMAVQSPFWATVVQKFEKTGSILTGLPLRCVSHPDEDFLAVNPEQIAHWAPDGGCARPCGKELPCGHVCPLKCHPRSHDDFDVRCHSDCRRLHPGCEHPCSKSCWQDCGKCDFEIAAFSLPCGHEAERVPCHAATSGTYTCHIMVEKQVTHCEHQMRLPCHVDASAVKCTVACGITLICCDRLCEADCHNCQQLSAPTTQRDDHSEQGMDDTSEKSDCTTPDLVPRLAHSEHQCGKQRKSCRHKCGAKCNMTHTGKGCGPCRERCDTQTCEHRRCDALCSDPCVICLEPCAWSCKHQGACPEPCGTPCGRLPCDEACDKLLACGHSCPSVCGEPCAQQLCQTCSTDHEKHQIVDLLGMRALLDLDNTASDLSERIITLTCGHTFTVETLDGHCEMPLYFTQNPKNGQWDGLRQPPSAFSNGPTCPTCRAQILSPRYGRPLARSRLDKHERRALARLGEELEKLQRLWTSIDVASKIDSLLSELRKSRVKAPKIDQPASHALRFICRDRQKQESEALLMTAHNLTNSKAFKVPYDIHHPWLRATSELRHLYEKARQLSESKTQLVTAFEAALSKAYQQARPKYPDDDPTSDARALAEAHRCVAMPRPQADTRIQIEAMLMMLHARVAMLRIATALQQMLDKERFGEARLWRFQVCFMLESSGCDAAKVIRKARGAKSGRLEMRAELLLYRIDFEHTRFLIELEKTMSSGFKAGPSTKRTASKITSRQNAANTEESLQRARKKLAAARERAEAAWEVFTATTSPTLCEEGETLSRELQAMHHSVSEWLLELGQGVVRYRPVTLSEKAMIIKAFQYADDGHFYRCPNGHSFTIGDCGQAMEVATCPECGEAIGGEHHRVLDDNSRDAELMELARATLRMGSLNPKTSLSKFFGKPVNTQNAARRQEQKTYMLIQKPDVPTTMIAKECL
ncbi:Helicases [Ceraceosorus bombacis]|uniref:Helicases n=1 Tax=Ceraceosorus bombacis TaxID=401625 RepID=A0A0P1BR60_9BASI|nr:Helicases [Ceraceosorus bombacis]